ncbi:uncharacterized protein A4U43_C07F3310 [Asparagus officinalis]|uniref:Uncharacterized protein n=2 Tax=Asparagus officinalis TaxID=4686 RepID=A0A5P1E9H0_ASPOF|nr:uncharacterized protein A4U43_C07F3310 [Asparagus officinalis]
MQDDDDDNLPETITSINASILRKPTSDIPPIGLMQKRKENQATLKKSRLARETSQKSKDKAQEEIDKLQKGILVLQTEKEYVKCSYENQVTKYWDIEKQIIDMQEEVFYLQDEYGVSVVIEDDEARALMAVTAINSCEKSINKLEEQQKRSIKEANVESERIKIAKEMMKVPEDIVDDVPNESLDSESLREIGKEHIDISSDLSVVELAEKINELVAKVIDLEVTASSQAARIETLKSEADVLHRHLQSFEEEKKTLVNDSNSLREKLNEAEEKLLIQDKSSMVDKISTVAHKNLDDISVEAMYHKHLEHVNTASLSHEVTSLHNSESSRSYDEELKETLSTKPSTGFGDISDKLRLSKTEKTPTDYGNKEVEVLNTGNNLVVESQGIQELGPDLEDRNIFEHSEAGSQVKEAEFSSWQVFDDVDPIKESIPQLEVEVNSSKADDNIHQNMEVKADFDNEHKVQIEDGTEGKETFLVSEYKSAIENYEEMKKRLSEVEKKNQENLLAMTMQISELESANAMKDAEIHNLRKSLRSAKSNSNQIQDVNLPEMGSIQRPEESENPRLRTRTIRFASFDVSDRNPLSSKYLKLPATDVQKNTSAIEEKFRRDIDTVLEDNLEFWLRFSTSFHGIQNFELTLEELQAEIKKVKHRKLGEGRQGSSHGKETNPESLSIDKQLRELKTELQVWLEQNELIQGELESKLSSLSSLQEEISGTLESSLESSLEADTVKFAPYQAAKFQGELLNIQLENNKVADELKAGLERVTELQAEVEKSLSRLHEKFELPVPGNRNNDQLKNIPTKNRVPLKSFLFNAKPKKRQSIFACVNPAIQRHMVPRPSSRPSSHPSARSSPRPSSSSQTS